MAEHKRPMDGLERVLESRLLLGCCSQASVKQPEPHKGAPAKRRSGLLNNHATTHLHVQRMTEPVAVIPVNPRLIRLEGH